MTAKEEIPDAAELDERTVANLLAEWDERWLREGQDWHAPAEWWHQRVSKLRIALETRAQLKALGVIDDD